MMTLASGLAVLDPSQDALLSRWVERDGDLSAYDRRIRDVFCPMIPRGGVVIDVGACLGTHTVAYAEAVGPDGRVVAIEPNQRALSCLRWNTRMLSHVEIWPVAASSRIGMLPFAISDYNAGGSTVTTAGDLTVLGLPIDDIFTLQRLDRLDYIKIDVEGHEHDVLLGARATIQAYHPIIVMEVGRNADAITLVTAWGYRWERAPVERPLQDPDPAVYDIICRWSA